MLIDNCDVILFLPGGIGTVYEIWAAIESKRSHEFNKPIIIYNAFGYFDPVIMMLDKIFAENFASLNDRTAYVVLNSQTEVLSYIDKLKLD